MFFFPSLRKNIEDDLEIGLKVEHWVYWFGSPKDWPHYYFALDPSKYKFTDEEVAAIVELGEVLREIRCEMIKEGYNIIDGKVQKIETIKLD
mgnify:CR=1 FL=1